MTATLKPTKLQGLTAHGPFAHMQGGTKRVSVLDSSALLRALGPLRGLSETPFSVTLAGPARSGASTPEMLSAPGSR